MNWQDRSYKTLFVFVLLTATHFSLFQSVTFFVAINIYLNKNINNNKCRSLFKALHLFIVTQWEFIDPYKIGEGLNHLTSHKRLGRSSLAYAEPELVKQSECSWKKPVTFVIAVCYKQLFVAQASLMCGGRPRASVGRPCVTCGGACRCTGCDIRRHVQC